MDISIKVEFTVPMTTADYDMAGLAFRNWLERCPEPAAFGIKFKQYRVRIPDACENGEEG